MKITNLPSVNERMTAFHEAGHAVAYWATGTIPDAVHLLSLGADGIVDRRGRTMRCLGLTEAVRFSDRPPLKSLSHEQRRYAVLDAQVEAMCCYAGPVAQARSTRLPLNAVLLFGGGDEDVRNASKVLRWLTMNPKLFSKLERRAIDAARALLRQTEYWQGVTALAERLLETGCLDSNELNRLLAQATGRACPDLYDLAPWLKLIPLAGLPAAARHSP